MNKIYLLTAAFAVMASLSGCSDTELASIDTAQEKTPIGFHTVGSQMGTRADVINSGNLKDYSFKVYAFTRNEADGSDDALFMGTNDTEQEGNGGIKISHDGTKWYYANPDNLKYWPTNALNFYAVSPVLKSDDPIFYNWQITPNTKKIHYVSFDEYGEGTFPYYDVMYAIATNQRKSNNVGKVQLQFRHITSQVVFKAKKQLSNMDLEIKSIQLHNFEHSGYFTIPADGTAPKQSDWKYKDLTTQKPSTVIKDATKITIGTDATDISSGKPMFLIPQELKKWDTSHNITTANTNKEGYLSIECKIKIDGFYKLGSDTEYKTLYVPFGANWKPGVRYVYTLVFGGGYDADGNTILQPINFEPSVEDWVEDTKNSTTDNDIPLYQQQ